jgi:hypothetical protein
MSTSLYAISSLILLIAGSLKIWLHMGTATVLALPTCNGRILNIPLDQANWFEQVHCWGCYAFALGLVMIAFAAFRQMQERRSVAYRAD